MPTVAPLLTKYQHCRRTLLLGSLLFAPALSRAAAPAGTLVLVGAAEVTGSFLGVWLELVYREALRRLNYTLELRSYPAGRASMLSDAGIVDGEISRAARYGERHPGMVRVDPAHFAINFAVYGKGARPIGQGWEGLRGSSGRVEYRSGVAVAEAELPKVVPDARLSSVDRTLHGLRKLKEGRTDLFVDVDSAVAPRLLEPEFAGSGIRELGVMESAPMHAYLHPRHRALAAELSAVLLRMKREGLIDKYRRLALRPEAG